MQPDYGLDAPGVVRNFAIAGAACAAGAIVLAVTDLVEAEGLLSLCAAMFWLAAALMVWSSRRGKLAERDRLLDDLALRGDEAVLDVGCGRGLLLVGAAQRLRDGLAVGVDLWTQTDQSGNSREAALANAAAEGVIDRVEVVDGDMVELPFDDETFDAVVSSIALHCLPDRWEREEACFEIARVVRPGGRVAILDSRATREYELAFEDAGLVDVRRSPLRLAMYPPVRVVTARRPADR